MENQGLYVKFNILIVGTIFFCGMIIGGMLLKTTSDSMVDSLISSGQEVASALAVTVGNDILLDDRFSMQERLARTKETNDQVRYIIVSYPNGAVLTSTFVQDLPEGLPAVRLPSSEHGIDSQLFASSEGRIREVMVPIEDGVIGYVRVGMGEKQMMAQLQDKCLQAILAVFFICVIASVLATRYAQSFLRPIRKLGFAVKQIDKGKYGIQVPVNSSDEIGQLASTFNNMSKGLRETVDENDRLVKALQQKEKDRAWLINQLFSAREDERRRISRELHDESSQSMASILTYLRVLHDKLYTDEQREMLFEIRELTASTLGSIRQIAVDLHPPLLEDLGLAVAIEKYLDPIKKSNPEIEFKLEILGNLSQLAKPVALMCYRTLQECIGNILKHARAKKVDIKLVMDEKNVHLTVRDDGVGFTEQDAKQARLNRHLGLVSMQERTELLKGRFSLDTTRGHGTEIAISLPIAVEEEGVEIDHEEKS